MKGKREWKGGNKIADCRLDAGDLLQAWLAEITGVEIFLSLQGRDCDGVGKEGAAGKRHGRFIGETGGYSR